MPLGDILRHRPPYKAGLTYSQMVAQEEERLASLGEVTVLSKDAEVPNKDNVQTTTFPPEALDRLQQIATDVDAEEQEKIEIGMDLMADSGDSFLMMLNDIAMEDARGLKKAQQSYGNSWKSRGGVGAFMMLARKWDRLENRVKTHRTFNRSRLGLPNIDVGPYDLFAHIASDERAEGIIDDVRDLRRYLLLVEAEMVARGFNATHRDNA